MLAQPLVGAAVVVGVVGVSVVVIGAAVVVIGAAVVVFVPLFSHDVSSQPASVQHLH